MKFEIVKLNELSGKKATIYSIIMNDDTDSLFGKFITENEAKFSDEIDDIFDKLFTIGKITGAREHFFKLNEGSLGDGLCALYDEPDKNLRLYCIKYGAIAIILGNGGFKPKSIRALQEDEKLTKENYLLRKISNKITESLIEKDITWSADGMNLVGNLIFTDDENDE